MAQSISFIGLDVHKESITAAALPEGEDGVVETRTLLNDLPRLLKWLRRIERRYGELRVCYEASGAGYVLHRELARRGIVCEVVAPSLIPRRPGERRKTDRRDAEQLAVLYRAGALTMVRVPDREDEAVRALIRCRRTLTQDILRARHQVLKHARRNGRIYREGRSHWTKKHWAWLEALELEHGPEQVALRIYLEKLRFLLAQRDAVDERIRDVAFSEVFQDRVNRLMCLKGIDLFGAMVLTSEIGDFRRFRSPKQLMDYVGLVPTERSSGETVRRGGITKAGNAHCRHVLVQASWAIVRTQPRVGERLRKHWEGQPPALIDLGLRAMKRLHARFWRLVSQGKPTQVAVVAVARELAGFVWAAARHTSVKSRAA